mmetsp:Transcript_5053/g.12519  ORF Transcript_5053/g.12519 Transcript_5053/m.12519 type:complete len:254 (+) Transcript_5053:223-984(+)
MLHQRVASDRLLHALWRAAESHVQRRAGRLSDPVPHRPVRASRAYHQPGPLVPLRGHLGLLRLPRGRGDLATALPAAEAWRGGEPDVPLRLRAGRLPRALPAQLDLQVHDRGRLRAADRVDSRRRANRAVLRLLLPLLRVQEGRHEQGRQAARLGSAAPSHRTHPSTRTPCCRLQRCTGSSALIPPPASGLRRPPSSPPSRTIVQCRHLVSCVAVALETLLGTAQCCAHELHSGAPIRTSTSDFRSELVTFHF